MGSTISISHWLIFAALYLPFPLATVRIERGRLSRAGFAGHLPIMAFVAMIAYGMSQGGNAAVVLLVLVLGIVLCRATARRLNDAGWSRWWALLWIVVPAGAVLAAVLCFKRSPVRETAEVFD